MEKGNGFCIERGNYMKTLNIYSEYINDSYVGSIKENISNSKDKNKSKVLNHLKNGEIIAAVVGTARDVFTNQAINGEWVLMTDGTYEWTSDIVYYYEKYNLILPPEFVKHAIEN